MLRIDSVCLCWRACMDLCVSSSVWPCGFPPVRRTDWRYIGCGCTFFPTFLLSDFPLLNLLVPASPASSYNAHCRTLRCSVHHREAVSAYRTRHRAPGASRPICSRLAADRWYVRHQSTSMNSSALTHSRFVPAGRRHDHRGVPRQ